MSAKDFEESTRIIDAEDGPGLDHGVGFLSHRDSPKMNTQAVLILGRSEGSLRLRLGTVGYYTPPAPPYPGYFFKRQ
jgi:hypothetical protein